MDENAKNEDGISGTYEQYIYGHTYAAKYKNGKKEAAVNAAFAACSEGFPRNNAIVALTVAVLRAEDAETTAILKTRLETIRSERGNSLNEADAAYLQSVIDLVNGYGQAD